jgi:hypothetical protein
MGIKVLRPRKFVDQYLDNPWCCESRDYFSF